MKEKSKEQLLEETHDYYWRSALDRSSSLDRIEEYYAKNLMGYGTPIDENIFSIDEIKALIIRQREQSVGIEMSYAVKPVFHSIIANGNAAFFVDEVTITMIIGSNKHDVFVRNTTIMEYFNSKWKIVHFHSSVPINASTETDTWGIDEWKKKNEELQKLIDERTFELRTSLEKLKATQNQLIQSEKLASLGELTAGIAHEIQNPLNFVNNFSELSVDLVKDLKDELKRPEKDEGYIDELFDDLSSNQEKINHHGKRASSIVKGMLKHSRASTGVRELTDINILADEYLRLAYHGLRAKDKDFNADFKTDFEESLPKINVVPQDIGRVLLNVINNAFYAVAHHHPKGGLHDTENYLPNVSVSTHYVSPLLGGQGGACIIKVKDNGIGMPESVRAKVFQPFFTTKPTGQGTGLGLSLAYDIVTKGHGGMVEVESKEGEGSTFILKIPFGK